jgi:NADH-quinone oxidoreductase subunit N
MFPTSSIVQNLQSDLLRDLLAFLPELILCWAIVGSLVLRMISSLNRIHLGYFALASSVLALIVAVAQWQGGMLDPRPNPDSSAPLPIFTGLLVYDAFAIYIRLFLLAFLAVALWLCLLTGIPDRDDAADFTTLLMGSTLGMMLMSSANHLLMVFIAVEMASVPSYALAGFLKGKRQGSEAALKYVVYGASASGIMLYGISMLAGKFGTGYFPDVALGFTAVMKSGNLDIVLLAGTLFILIGLGFKLAAVPFHFWCPDVFEGAAAEVAAFLSVASKGAALALTARFLLTITAKPDIAVFLSGSIGLVLAVLAAATMTFGNLAALGQTNLKRLLAYSTIAHAGYMMTALVALSPSAAGAMLYYLIAYFLMNLGAFAVVAFLRNLTGSEDLSSFGGMIQRAPILVVTLAFFLLSLLGLPPLAGFAAKFQIFASIYETGESYRRDFAMMSYVFYGLLAIAAINTVISAAYYLKILRVMILDAPPEDAPPLRVSPGAALLTSLLTVGVIVVGVAWNPLTRATKTAVAPFVQERTMAPIAPKKLREPVPDKG